MLTRSLVWYGSTDDNPLQAPEKQYFKARQWAAKLNHQIVINKEDLHAWMSLLPGS
jgi:hypothetical protein